jgi:hypothetical protein
MNILLFLASHWSDALFTLALVVGIVIALRRGQLAVLERVVFALVAQAEREFGTGTGALKLAAVVGWVYERLPALFKALLTRAQLEKLVEGVLETAKTAWEKNPNLREYVKPEQQ